MRAGPEIGVASTKAFEMQVLCLTLLGLALGRLRGHLSLAQGRKLVRELQAIPDKLRRILAANSRIRTIARKHARASDFLFMGRQYNFPIALEGALKLKEISYIHAEGYPSAEMKHGPIASITPEFPSVFVVPRDAMYEKNMSNVEEIKARRGPVIAVATEGDKAHRPQGRRCDLHSADGRLPAAAADGGPAATAGLPHRRAARLRRG